MSKINSTRNGCKDVFHASLVKNAHFSGNLEFPCIKSENLLPNKLVPFSKAIGSDDYDCWIHFYEDDYKFERIWDKPKKYLPIIKRFKGAISPDFSLYRDMPLVLQQWNTYRNQAIGYWLQENGIPLIPNVRFGDERTYNFCCEGVPKGSSIAIGSHGCIKLKTEQEFFKKGLSFTISELQPKTIIIYGSAPDSIFWEYRTSGIKVLQFDSEIASYRKAVSA